MPVPTARSSIAQLREFVITPAGREALTSAPNCQCDWRVLDNMLVCANCFTAWELRRSTHWALPDKR